MLKEGHCPSVSFDNILKMARKFGSLIGMDIASSNFRLNWINSIVIMGIILNFIFTITTIVDLFEENPAFVLEACCTMGSVLQGAGKLVAGFVYTKNFLALRYELEELYREYELKGDEYVKALNRSCKRVRTSIKIFGLSYLYCVLGFVTVPIAMYIFTKKRYLMMHFLLPGLDVRTDVGFFITTLAHGSCVYVGAFGLYCGDMFVVIFLLQSLLFADIFGLKIKELNACLEHSEDFRMQRVLLKDIINWHKKYNAFNTLCNETLYLLITVQITTAGISILCTLFVLLTGDWPCGYAYISLPVVSLYSYCLLGTEIEICVSFKRSLKRDRIIWLIVLLIFFSLIWHPQNEHFSSEIYDINWFLLPPKEQEPVCLALLKSQTPATISIAGVMPLSVGTALKISKSIYSIFMMMKQMFAK